MSDEYPENLLRGISSSTYVTENGMVLVGAFQFSERPKRSDDLTDMSINWEYDQDAVQFTLNQTKNDRPQYPGGVAILVREEIDRWKLNTAYNQLSYEKQPLSDNRYHGNLLIPASSDKRVIRAFEQGLATRSTLIPR